MNLRKVSEWGMHQGEWIRLSRRETDPRPVAPVHRGEIDDDMSRSSEKLKQSRSEATKLAILADQQDASNRELESTLIASKKLCQYMKGLIPFAGEGGNYGDFPAQYVIPKSEVTQPVGGEGLTPEFHRNFLGEPDPKDKDLTGEQKLFLRNLRNARR